MAPAGDRPYNDDMLHAARLVLPFAFGYFLSYLYRSVNAVIADDLTTDIGLEPATLGLLTAAYFVSFAAFQLPLGMLLDRFGPRRVEAGLLVLAAAGAFLFSLGEGPGTLTAARALIGLGVSACLMAAFQNNVLWWPAERLPLMNGLILASGGLGALVATTPIAAMLAWTDWRGIFRLLAALTLLSAAILILVVPEPRRTAAAPPRLGTLMRGVAAIYRSAAFWRVAPVAVLTQSTFMAYQGLWAAAWLAAVDGLGRAAIADRLGGIALGMTFGFVVLGFVATRLDRAGVPVATTTTVILALFLVLQASLVVPGVDLPAVQWPLFGLLGTGSILFYAILSRSVPAGLAGRANTALNLLVFVGAFAAQAGVGALIDGLGGLGMAAPAAHRVALGIMLALSAAAFVGFLRAGRRDTEEVIRAPE